MGSGKSGLYIGTIGSSQAYAPSYEVTQDMRKLDIERGIYGKNGYRKNPTAQTIESSINGNYIGNKHTNRLFIYAVNRKGDIIIGQRNGNGQAGDPTPHPTLIGGKNPKVVVAGILDVRGGKIYSFNHMSGHFKPNIQSMEAAKEAFGKLPESLFHKNFRRKK